ncbi:MAG: hypothetical protein IJD04_06930 [Desulfovibrionaceae bacterium]|nr:hypothetical protein [Desulfovibrionaceae bacterium]
MENENRETIQKQGAEPEPVLSHDGIGLELEDVRNLLIQKHGENIGKDDPILMTVTILNAFLVELAKVNERHHQALTRVMSASTEQYITGVKTSVDGLKEKLSSASIDTIKAVLEQEDAKRQEHSQVMKWTSAIITMSALINVAVFILR